MATRLVAVFLSLVMLPFVARAALFDRVVIGIGSDSHTHSNISLVRLALQRDWNRRWFGQGDWYLTGAWEAEISAWHNSGRGGGRLFEVGFRPLVRLVRRSGSLDGAQFYIDGGVGPALISRTAIGNRQFSTAFQFGSHVGAGVRFGHNHRYALSWRFAHYSNADIKKPNDGINFNMLNFSARF